MKTKLSLIVFVLFLVLQFPCSLYAGSPVTAFNDSVTLKIDLIDEFKGIGTGSGAIFPARGYKFVAVEVRVINISETKQEVILDEICLPDTLNMIKYRPEFVMKVSLFAVYKKKYATIKKGDSLYRRLVYAVPKDFIASCVLYNKKIWTIEK